MTKYIRLIISPSAFFDNLEDKKLGIFQFYNLDFIINEHDPFKNDCIYADSQVRRILYSNIYFCFNDFILSNCIWI